MAYQLESPENWPPGVYQIAVTDPVLGGSDGPPNLMGTALANRALYQRMRNVTPWSADLAALHAYPAGACVMHLGVSWRAKVDNDVPPGSDAAKWERWGFSESELSAAVAGSNSNIAEVVNNTYIGPTPQKLRVFSPGTVLTDMPNIGQDYVLQTLVLTGARRARIFAHASFRNDSTTASCTIGSSLRVDGADVFGGHYLGAELQPKVSGNAGQIPLTIMDAAYGLNPETTYTITLTAQKGVAVGPIIVKDSYIDVEYV